MQTFRECRRGLTLPLADPGAYNCAEPLAFADLVLSCETELSASQQQVSGAARAVLFAGCHGQLEYAAQVFPGDTALPCRDVFTMHSALVVLPLAEGAKSVPAYIPNIAISRSQLSVNSNTQMDTDERMLWYRFDNMWWLNPDPDACDNGDQPPFTQDIVLQTLHLTANTFKQNPTQFQVKARARIDERHGLFLVRNFVCGIGVVNANLVMSTWSYLRLAVAQTR